MDTSAYGSVLLYVVCTVIGWIGGVATALTFRLK